MYYHTKMASNKSKRPPGRVYVYDFTLKASIVEDRSEIIDVLKEHCKKWAFQLEKGGTTGYLHYQGRFSLVMKNTKENVLSFFPWEETDISHTSNACKGDQLYVIKADTRVEGPWTDKDVQTIPIPRQYRHITKDLFYPFQNAFMDLCSLFIARVVYCLVDFKGCGGKSAIATILHCWGLGTIIPDFEDAEKMMGFIFAAKPKNVFLDLPRATSKKNQRDLFSMLEKVKDGKIYDPRYKSRLDIIDSPGVFVFTNEIPDVNLLSIDRWRFFTINEHKELVLTSLEDLNLMKLNYSQ